MEQRAQVAAGILDRIMETIFERHLTARERLPQRPSDGVAHATARFSARLLGARGRPVGDLRVVVLVPQDADRGAAVTVRWTRDGYGFWYEKETRVGAVAAPEDADLVGVDMVLTAVGWTAEGSVPLRSMIRVFRKVRKTGAAA
jgi:hypothetical protein